MSGELDVRSGALSSIRQAAIQFELREEARGKWAEALDGEANSDGTRSPAREDSKGMVSDTSRRDTQCNIQRNQSMPRFCAKSRAADKTLWLMRGVRAAPPADLPRHG